MLRTTLAIATVAATAFAQRQRYSFAECTVYPNPNYLDHPGWTPSGQIIMAQSPEQGPIWLRAKITGMPEAGSQFGFAINQNPWDGMSCESAGVHYNPEDTDHGPSGAANSHVGDLPMLRTNYYYEGQMFTRISKPDLSGLNSVMGRAITIYEFGDDMGELGFGDSLVNGNAGRPIACCNILPMHRLNDPRNTFNKSNDEDDRRRLGSSTKFARQL